MIRWPAPAKLNLFLHITHRRADGYHELQTAFQFLDYGDELQFEITDSPEIKLKQSVYGVADEDNLIVRAAKRLQQYSGCSKGAVIHIEKRLPMGGGLGGGSSDAATTLVVLNRLWNLDLSVERLMKMGLSLGADVPVFVFGHSAWAEGRKRLLACLTTNHFRLMGKPFTSSATNRFSFNSAATVWADISAIPMPTMTACLMVSLLPNSRPDPGRFLLPAKSLSETVRVPDPGSRKRKVSCCSSDNGIFRCLASR